MQPFLIDPIFLGRLYKRDVRALAVGLGTALITAIATSWIAALEDEFKRPAHSADWWVDVGRFMLRRPRAAGTSMPYLSDYPSLMIGMSIIASVPLVYGLFRSASTAHTDMHKMGCLRFQSLDAQVHLEAAVTAMNERLRKVGMWSPLALLLCVGSMVTVNLLIARNGLYPFLSGENLARNWWASLKPLRPGGVAWVALGSVGIYMVYVEAVLGFNYTRLLRQFRDEFRFSPNIYNPDGFYGWLTARQIISNMEAGVITTFNSSFALSFVLPSAVGVPISAGLLTVFAFVVLYVFVGVTYAFRRQVKAEKMYEIQAIESELEASSQLDSLDSIVRRLWLHQKIDFILRVPNNPIRAAWLIAGAATILIPLIILAVNFAAYVAPPK